LESPSTTDNSQLTTGNQQLRQEAVTGAPRIERLTDADVADVTDVLADAFSGYPVMRFVLGPQGDTQPRLTQLVHLFVYRRARLGGPLFGLRADDGRLVGAAVMTLPDEPEPPADVLQLREDVFQALGPECRARHEAYAAVAKTVLVSDRHHHLNMIGIRRTEHGQGFARPLLQAAIDLTAADPSSAGLTLTTETPANVRLYEHFGFKVTGHARVSSECGTWGLFRATRN
jgi:GNAT superfamily N-acetyltransferase